MLSVIMQNVVILIVMAPFTIPLNRHLFQGIDRNPNYNRGISKRHSTVILGTYTQMIVTRSSQMQNCFKSFYEYRSRDRKRSK
jgi:hypothetical protein